MKKLTITALLICSFASLTFSQIIDNEDKLKKIEVVADSLKGWHKGGVTNLNFSQISFSNWATGGENSMSLNGLFSLYANYKDTKNSWDNTLDIGYGILKQSNYKNGFMKTNDRIDLMSKYGRKAFTNFYYTGLINFRTQFSPGYNYPNDSVVISDFMSPGYLMGAIGLNYQPSGYFSAFVAPVSTKMTFVTNEALSAIGAYGVEKGKKSRTEFGGYARLSFSKSDFKQEFLKNISFSSKIDLFSNYLKNPQNVDVNWETLIAMKVNKYINISLSTTLVYDDDILILKKDGRKSPGLQFKEIFGVGFSYNF